MIVGELSTLWRLLCTFGTDLVSLNLGSVWSCEGLGEALGVCGRFRFILDSESEETDVRGDLSSVYEKLGLEDVSDKDIRGDFSGALFRIGGLSLRMEILSGFFSCYFSLV